MLPPKALLTRLSNRLKLLTGGARDLPARQRTLRGAIEWSHDLLEEGEKTLFARLSVFSGGRTLEAIDAICDAEGDLPVDVFDGVSSLLEKSLLRQEEGPEDEPRFVMLETIHEYAREKRTTSISHGPNPRDPNPRSDNVLRDLPGRAGMGIGSRVTRRPGNWFASLVVRLLLPILLCRLRSFPRQDADECDVTYLTPLPPNA